MHLMLLCLEDIVELRFIPASSKLTLFETAIPDNKVYVITEIRRRTDIQSAKKATSTGQSNECGLTFFTDYYGW